MKKILAAVVALLLAVGCSTGPQYPRAELPAPPDMAPLTLHITLPAGSDDILDGTMLTLEAKLKEFSKGQLTLETSRSEDVAADLMQEGTGLFLLSAGEMARLDPRLSFTQMPFLFQTQNQLLALLNNENGAVRSSASTRNRLGGEIVGIYYGGTTWLMGRGVFYDEVGFYSTVGVLSGMAGNSCFAAIGGEKQLEGTGEELFQAFAAEKIKYCELLPTDTIPPPALEKMKNLELTNHRFNSLWLVLKNADGAIPEVAVKMVKEAFAYTVEQQNSQRLDSETEIMARLEEQLGLDILTEAQYPLTKKQAKKYYQENWQQVGIPPDIWAELTAILGR